MFMKKIMRFFKKREIQKEVKTIVIEHTEFIYQETEEKINKKIL